MATRQLVFYGSQNKLIVDIETFSVTGTLCRTDGLILEDQIDFSNLTPGETLMKLHLCLYG